MKGKTRKKNANSQLYIMCINFQYQKLLWQNYPISINCTLTSILDGSIQVKNMKVPFLRDRPWKMLRNVERADSSTGLGALILGEIASSKASQKVLPSMSLTSTICNDFSWGAAIQKINVSILPLSGKWKRQIDNTITLKNWIKQGWIPLNLSCWSSFPGIQFTWDRLIQV